MAGFLYSLSHPHILVSIFGVAFCFFSAEVFFSRFRTGKLFTYFRFLHFVLGFCSDFAVAFVVVSWLLSCFSIFSLCICFLTTNILMLTCLYLWGMLMLVSGKTYVIFIQFILIFLLLYFSNSLLCSIQNTSSKFVKYIC